MAIHALPATVDIDLLIQPGNLPDLTRIASGLGYTFEAAPMRFRQGDIEIRRLSKIDPESADTLSLDLLLVTTATTAAWHSRQTLAWEGCIIRVVSRDGLIALKSLRDSEQDRDDIALLRDDDEG